MKLKVYISGSFNPYRNLATEEYLCNVLDGCGGILYLWINADTVVIGRHQNAYTECDLAAAERDNVFVARRKTGGGTVFHDKCNLNFSFITPAGTDSRAKNFSVIISALASYGLECRVSGRNDILCGDKKFSGNAFFNGKDFCLHHGTVMLDVDTAKIKKYLTPPAAKLAKRGLGSVESRVVNLRSLCEEITSEGLKIRLAEAFAGIYGGDIIPAETDKEKIDILEKEYSAKEFILGDFPVILGSFEENSAYALAKAGGRLLVLSDSLDTEFISALNDALNYGGKDFLNRTGGILFTEERKAAAEKIYRLLEEK